MAERIIQTQTLAAIANAIREKSGTAEAMTPQQMPERIGQIQAVVPDYTWKVEAVSGASYGFVLNQAGYYESANKGIHSSYALCRVRFTLNKAMTPVFRCINYAESTYDYGLLSNLDTDLTLSYLADTDGVFKSFKGQQSAGVVEVPYGKLEPGDHFVDVKFIKDSMQSSNNDTLQFTLIFTEEETGLTLQEKSVAPTTSQQTVTPDTGYDGLSRVTVSAMPVADQATPTITVSADGVISASSEQAAGYVEKGTKTATAQLTAQAAQTITPGTKDQTIASGRFLTGAQTIKGDANLAPGNIKSGVSIFGVAGSYAGSGGGAHTDALTAIIDGTGGDVSLPDGITKIRDSCFYLFTGLALTELPDTVETIEQYAFYGCQYITLKKLPAALTTIGGTAFRNCRSMAITQIPASVATIGTNAFAQCTGLTSITFLGTPTSLASTAFYSCTNLKTLNVPWAEGAVAGAPWGATNATITYNYTGG